MEDERAQRDIDAASNANGAKQSAARPPKGRRRWPFYVAAIVMVPLAIIALWTVIALNWSYSEGQRAGYIQKFSKKGWVCKTWEGELAMVNMPGAMPEKFVFTVRDENVATKLNSLMGDRVSITYNEHPGIPFSCFGDTRYYVVDAKAVK